MKNINEFMKLDTEKLRQHFSGHTNEQTIIPPTTVYDHNREDHETDHDDIPLTWTENLTVAAICVLGTSVVIGIIYLIAR